MDTTVADPLVGQVLDDRYRVESRIARGGMATVYRALDLKLDRVIALKVMHEALAGDEDFVRRFIGEAKAAAGLSHPNIVAVYDQGTDRGRVFLAMEYVPGTTLRELLARRGRLGPRAALEIMMPVLAALGAAHQTGLVHRDVKPENILVTEDGQVKVVDFGLARAVAATSQTKTGMIIGTVGYLAPEQVVSGTADARSDVYAAGIVLFETLTGRQPHAAETPLAVAYKHVNEPVPPPSSVIPGLPAGIDWLVGMTTSHDPARRPYNGDYFHREATGVLRALPPDIDQALASASPYPVNGTQTLNVAHGTQMLPAGEMPPVPGPSFLDRLMAAGTSRYTFLGLGLVVVVLAGWITWSQTLGSYTDVPKLTGMPVADAQRTAQAADLKVKVTKGEYSPAVPKGRVLAVRPAPGKEVKKGATITLVPSRGPKPVPVPSVSGLTPDQAIQRIQQSGLKPAQPVNRFSSTVRRGLVIGTEPAAGRRQTPGEPVTILVSNGIKVPALVGLQIKQAENVLRQAGLVPAVQERDDNSRRPGTVLEQNPVAGSGEGLDRGATVTLIVVKGKGGCPWWNPVCNDDD